MNPRSRPLGTSVVSLVLGLVVGLLPGLAVGSVRGLVPASVAAAAPPDNPDERGPDPTWSSIEARRGPFEVVSTSVPDRSTAGFGSATITYPTSTADGAFGAVAVSPGYLASKSSIAWLGPRLASQGFVVITFNTSSRLDLPAARGDQLLAALDHLTRHSSAAVRARIDPGRLAVVGHSMGGGGTLEAAKDRPWLEATVGLTPWNLDTTWPEVRTPSLIVGAEYDAVAPVGLHALPFYRSLPSATSKAYLELGGAGHFAPTRENTTIGWSTTSWLKLYVDDDARYRQFLCPGPQPPFAGAVSDYRNACRG